MQRTPQLLSRSVRSFLKLAETLSYSEAAKSLEITQPALTLQIQKLEAELGEGVRLFERGRGGVLLTPAGTAFLGHTSIAKQELEYAAQAVDLVRGMKRGTLRIGYSQGHLDLISDVVSDLLREWPGLTISVTETMARRVRELILEGTLDVGIAYDWQPSEKIDVTLAAPTPLTLVVPETHSLVGKRIRDVVASLSGTPFILLQSGLAVRRTIDLYMVRQRLEPRTVLETDDAALIFSLVRKGIGVTIFPVTPATDLRGLKTMALPDSEPQATALLSRKGIDHPAVREFIQAVVAKLGDEVKGSQRRAADPSREGGSHGDAAARDPRKGRPRGHKTGPSD